jgi:hypothetical protein
MVSKALGEELAATLSDGAAGVTSMVLVVGGGRGSNLGQAAVASVPDSVAGGGMSSV